MRFILYSSYTITMELWSLDNSSSYHYGVSRSRLVHRSQNLLLHFLRNV